MGNQVMENIGIIVQISILLLIVVTPFLVLSIRYRASRKNGFISTNLYSIPICFGLVVIFTYWPHYFTDLRLEMMNFDFNGMSDKERARNVEENLHEEATKLYWSHMGIGWPLQAMFIMALVFPYPSVVFWFLMIFKK